MKRQIGCLLYTSHMPIIEISSLSHPGVEIFSTLNEAQLRNRIEPAKGIFIAEGPKVISVAIDAGYKPLAPVSYTHLLDARSLVFKLKSCKDFPKLSSLASNRISSSSCNA